MASRTVDVRKRCEVAAPAAWAVGRDFSGSWHPLLEWVERERGEHDSVVRRFKAKDDPTIYRERLTYFSDWDRTFSYRHLEGIQGVASYEGELRVLAEDPTSSSIEWRANFVATEPRAGEIADGTRAVFEAGIAAIIEAAGKPPRPVPGQPAPAEDVALKHLILPGEPDLGLSHTQAQPGPLCLFLHGIGGRRTNWLAQLAAAAVHLQAAALDLRGYGDSRLGPHPSRVDDYCADILRVMAALGKEEVVLCGLSYGSWIAASFAMRHPDKLRGLVFSGGCTGMSEASPEERTAFLQARELPLEQGQTPADFAPGVLNVIAGPSISQGTWHELFESMAAIAPETYCDAVRCFTRPEERLDFSRLTMPVLLMTGEHDRLASPGEIRGVSRRILAESAHPNVRFEAIAGAGHVCNLESPSRYNELLAAFLADIAP